MLRNGPWSWRLGEEPVLVYEETDSTFGISIAKGRHGRYLFLTAFARDITEVRYLDAATPDGEWTVFHPRTQGLEYGLDEGGDRFFITTDYNRPDYRVMEAPTRPTPPREWRETYTPAAASL